MMTDRIALRVLQGEGPANEIATGTTDLQDLLTYCGYFHHASACHRQTPNGVGRSTLPGCVHDPGVAVAPTDLLVPCVTRFDVDVETTIVVQPATKRTVGTDIHPVDGPR